MAASEFRRKPVQWMYKLQTWPSTTRVLEELDEEEGVPAYLVSGLGRTASSAATTRYFSHSISGNSAIFCLPGRSRCSPAYINFVF